MDTEIVTAARHPTALGATSREAYLVTADDMRRTGAETVADALRFVPGVVVQSYGSSSSLQTVALRGASTAQTLVLLDGRPVNEPDSGLVDFSSLPLDGVERVEVVEGGSSTLYGSSAVGGVINIITSASAPDQAYAELGYEGAFDSGVSASIGDPRTLQARIGRRMAWSQNVFDYPAFGGAPAGTRTNDDARVEDSTATLTKTAGRLTARLNLQDDASVIGAPGDVAFGASGLARQQRYYDRSDLSLSLPDARGAWTFEAYADDRRLHYFDPTNAAPCFCPFDTLTHATTRGVGLRRTGTIGSADTLTIGYESRGDRAMFDASYYASPTVVADSDTAWYVEDEYASNAAPISLSAGVRGERTQGTLSSVLPSAGLEVRIRGGMLVRANYSRAFRAPSLDERYFPGFGNPALQPEYAGTGDVGIVKSFGAGMLSVTAFGSDTNNLIVNVPIDNFGDLEPVNVNRSMLRGTNLYLATPAGKLSTLRFSYTDYFVARDLTAGTRLLYRPSAVGSAEWWRRTGSDEYGAGLTFVGKRFADEANTELMPAYVSLNLHDTREIGRHFALTLRVDNLLRHQVEDVFGYPVNGPVVRLRVDVRP